MTRVPPHDLEAERALLGAMMLTRESVRAGAATCSAGDFYKPAHGLIFSAAMVLHFRGGTPDPVTVAAELARDGNLERCGGHGELAKIQADTPGSMNASHYAAIVAELAACRRAMAFGSELMDLAGARDLDAVARKLTSASAVIEAPSVLEAVGEDFEQHVGHTVSYDWIVPRMLERYDRLILTGPEGFGKTTLFRQLAVQFAIGRHPWGHAAFDPISVLHVDLQDSQTQSVRAYRWLHKITGGRYHPGRLSIMRRMAGMNLVERADLRWLDQLIGYHAPDVLFIGPLTKAFRGAEGQSKSSEEAAEAAQDAFDALRDKHGIAVVIEAHAGHGDSNDRNNWRPRGSSTWLSWPEFGVGMSRLPGDTRATKLVHWRGARDAHRPWPEFLHMGGRPEKWPWIAPGDPDDPEAKQLEF